MTPQNFRITVENVEKYKVSGKWEQSYQLSFLKVI